MTQPDRETILSAVGRLGRALQDWPGEAAVVGGIAIVARVRPRLTTDIDVVIRVAPSQGAELLDNFVAHGWQHDPEETKALIEGGLVRFWSPPSARDGVGLDLIFVDSPFLDCVVARATEVAIGDTSLAVATTEDLLLMKLEANRPQDIDDILAIKDACAEGLDMEHVRTTASELGVLDRLELYFGSA